MLSVMPAEIVAHAVSVAVRTASSWVVPDAVAQFVRPLNSMQTSQVNWLRPMVQYTSAPTTRAMKAIAARIGFDIVQPIVQAAFVLASCIQRRDCWIARVLPPLQADGSCTGNRRVWDGCRMDEWRHCRRVRERPISY